MKMYELYEGQNYIYCVLEPYNGGKAGFLKLRPAFAKNTEIWKVYGDGLFGDNLSDSKCFEVSCW